MTDKLLDQQSIFKIIHFEYISRTFEKSRSASGCTKQAIIFYPLNFGVWSKFYYSSINTRVEVSILAVAFRLYLSKDDSFRDSRPWRHFAHNEQNRRKLWKQTWLWCDHQLYKIQWSFGWRRLISDTDYGTQACTSDILELVCAIIARHKRSRLGSICGASDGRSWSNLQCNKTYVRRCSWSWRSRR